MKSDKDTKPQDAPLCTFTGFLVIVSLGMICAIAYLAAECADRREQVRHAEERLKQLRRDAVYLNVGEWKLGPDGETEFALKRR